jgi:hypothetical protein
MRKNRTEVRRWDRGGSGSNAVGRQALGQRGSDAMAQRDSGRTRQ